MIPFSVRRDGASSPGLSQEVVAEAGLDPSSPGSAVAGHLGILQRDSVEELIPELSDCGFPGLCTT